MNGVNIKIDLGIEAKQIIHQIQMHNDLINEKIEEGIKLALEDIENSNNFVQSIRERTKTELEIILHNAVMSWEVKNKISKTIEEKLGAKIQNYADDLATKITSNLF